MRRKYQHREEVNPAGGNGAVHHSLARDGGGEQITIDLARLPQDICRIAFTITIHAAEAKGQNFGEIDQVRVVVCNKDTREVLLEYEVREQLMVETALVPAELYRHNGAWKFNAIGSGFKGGLEALCINFGIEVFWQFVGIGRENYGILEKLDTMAGRVVDNDIMGQRVMSEKWDNSNSRRG